MPKYEFEVQNCIKVILEAETKMKARSYLIWQIDCGEYDDQLSNDCYISDGKEVN